MVKHHHHQTCVYKHEISSVHAIRSPVRALPGRTHQCGGIRFSPCIWKTKSSERIIDTMHERARPGREDGHDYSSAPKCTHTRAQDDGARSPENSPDVECLKARFLFFVIFL